MSGEFVILFICFLIIGSALLGLRKKEKCLTASR
jgi:hypothetical protein